MYNHLTWNVVYDKESRLAYELKLEHGKPLLFGPPDARKAVVMQGVMPTAENVALTAFHRLEPHLKPARLLKVRVVETENNAAEVNAD